jgi:PIN domain nuclease of toxin-antitoxin system
MLNLDTHIVLEFFRDGLRREEEHIMDREAWGISAIVIWEIYNLAHLDKIELDVESPAFNRDLNRIHVWPITTHVCRQLRRLDFRADPADEIIAATSLAHGVPLLTRDMTILRSKVVPLALTA